LNGTCPECGISMVPKCGEIKIWHWAHPVGEKPCWCEGETEWHLSWKSLMPATQTEVIIMRHSKKHRADIVLDNGLILEVQHSYLSPQDIRDREVFYGPKLRWIFDCTDSWQRIIIRNKGEYVTFRWLHGRKTIATCKRPVYLDLGGDILAVKKLYVDSTMAGWGYLLERRMFIQHLRFPGVR